MTSLTQVLYDPMDLATPVVLTNQQAGWVKLSLYKKNLFESLQRSELAVQAKLIPRPSDMAALQAAIKEAKSIASQAKADRMEFTRLIEDKLTKPSMEYEKRMDALIEEASSEELAIRKAERDKEMQAQKKEDEKARFKVFVQNEYVRIQADYKMRLRNAFDFAYRTALKAGVKGEKEKWIEDTEKTMRKYTLSEFRKFDLQLLSKEEAKYIYTSIPAYDATPDLDSELFRMRGFFDNLDIEIEHAEEAIRQMEEQSKAEEEEMKQQAERTQAANQLFAQVEAVKIDVPKVKVNLKAVVDNSASWALLVIRHFVTNFSEASAKVRVRSWDKLTLGQMADALAKVCEETGQSFEGIQFQEVEK